MNRTATTRARMIPVLVFLAAAPTAALAAGPAASQEPPAAPTAPAPAADPLAEQRDAIARLAEWVGEWDGSGWAVSRAGREEFTIHESVQSKVGGLALLIQGLGKSKSAGGEEVVTHDALAVVTWDPEGDRYVFQHYTAEGQHGQAELEPLDDGWRWGFHPSESVHVRFTARIGEGSWHERGEVSLDGGATWRPMLEMELSRAGG